MALTKEQVQLVRMYQIKQYRSFLTDKQKEQGRLLANRKATLGDMIDVIQSELEPMRNLLTGAVSQGMVLQRLGVDKELFTDEEVEATMKVIEKENAEAVQKTLKEVTDKAQQEQKKEAQSKGDK